ncbi:MAG: alcohol dehydrogenase catalytic domain-containing protein [Leptospirales bacterium]|nr:alcohol dehydrogenase catalytic domain-containing protein [Leptospirales bacterium]
MSRFDYEAPEYQADGSFQTTHFTIEGSAQSGWRILRNSQAWMELGPGYEALPTLYCGVCSTDLARRFLPYPLPQVIGHEVVALHEGRPAAIEINASHLARGLHDSNCPFCSKGINTQCPQRITLGIDRLPGGFSPMVLAPVEAIVPVPENISPLAAALTEPFAAALQGVDCSQPRRGERIAVLGPRRLGALMIAALNAFRKECGYSFTIVGVARHDSLLQLSRDLGADEALDLRQCNPSSLDRTFDLVFDTTGSMQGLELALNMARRAVHLKSTNGQAAFGMQRLTDLVVDELALLPFHESNLNFKWPAESEARENRAIFAAPALNFQARQKLEQWAKSSSRTVYSLSPAEAADRLDVGGYPPQAPYPRFDLAVVDSLADADSIIRPTPPREFSLLRARGAILLAPHRAGSPIAPEVMEKSAAPSLADSLLERRIAEGLELHSSRCGDFRRALAILSAHPEIAARLQEKMITQLKPLSEISEAFQLAADSGRSVKVVMETR